MLVREGYAFKTVSDAMKVPVMIPSHNHEAPLYMQGGIADNLTGIRAIIEKKLIKEKIALIIIEGVGLEEFQLPSGMEQDGLTTNPATASI